MNSPISQGFSKSLAMTLVSEFGDRTFCVTAVLAMRYPRRSVFFGCLSSVIVTTILWALVGWAAPNLIPKELAHHVITLLFFGFGLRSLWEAYTEDEDDNEELEQVEKELDAESKANAGKAEETRKNDKDWYLVFTKSFHAF